MTPEIQASLLEIYRRERLSFLQYVGQASPYAGPADRPMRDRVLELARTEAAELNELAEYLDRNHVTLSSVGAFPTAFTNYNFVAVRKLVPELVVDERRGLQALQYDAALLPEGENRALVEKLAAAKQTHLNELEKLTQ
jgi:hypothetical protein